MCSFDVEKNLDLNKIYVKVKNKTKVKGGIYKMKKEEQKITNEREVKRMGNLRKTNGITLVALVVRTLFITIT